MVKDFKFAIVLSGGASKGAYQFGFLKALAEKIPMENINLVFSSSIGIINGYAFVTQNLDRAEEVWRNLDCKGFFGVRKVMHDSMYLDSVSNILVREDDILHTKFFVTECALPDFSVYYWPINEVTTGERVKLMQLGLSFPFMFRFGKFKKKYYSDGGIIDNIPVYPLYYNMDKFDVAIVLHCDPQFKPNYKLFDNGKLVLDFVVNIESDRKRESFNFSQNSIRQNIVNGYQYGSDVLNKLLADDVRTLEDMKKVFQEIYKNEIPKRKAKKAAGTLVTMLNDIYWKTYFDNID